MERFRDRIHRAANLLSLGIDEVEVAEKLQADGADVTEAILTTIAAKQYLKDFENEETNPAYMKKDIKEKSKQKRTLTILRGISGSGKTTYVLNHLPKATHCSADQFFIQKDGSYKFDIRLLGAAHKYCKKRCRMALARGDELIAIDNTNSTQKEMSPYLKLAKEFGYEVEVIRIKCDLEKAIKRNTKGTPDWVIRRMYHRFTDYPNEKVIEN